MMLRIVDDFIEFDGIRVAKLVMKITPTLLDRLDVLLDIYGDIEDEMDLFSALDPEEEPKPKKPRPDWLTIVK